MSENKSGLIMVTGDLPKYLALPDNEYLITNKDGVLGCIVLEKRVGMLILDKDRTLVFEKDRIIPKTNMKKSPQVNFIYAEVDKKRDDYRYTHEISAKDPNTGKRIPVALYELDTVNGRGIERYRRYYTYFRLFFPWDNIEDLSSINEYIEDYLNKLIDLYRITTGIVNQSRITYYEIHAPLIFTSEKTKNNEKLSLKEQFMKNRTFKKMTSIFDSHLINLVKQPKKEDIKELILCD